MEQKFELAFDMENAAFYEVDYTTEVVRILKDITSKIERGSHSGPVMDVNGNTIGAYHLSRGAE